jgi:hypothetical protein
MNPPFIYWANEDYVLGDARYWVHDREECRFAAMLEGQGPLIKMTNGDNPNATCQLCRERFLPDYPGTGVAS